MLRLVGVTIPDDVDLFNGLRMIKGLDTKHNRTKIEHILTKARLYTRQVEKDGRVVKVYPKVGQLSWKEKRRLIDLVDIPRASISNVRMSPRKLRLVADEIRGKTADEALAILSYMPKAGAPVLLKLLKSALANASNNHDLKADDLIVAKVLIDGGPTMRRYMARARGRACRIRKRTSHALIVLREKFVMPKAKKTAGTDQAQTARSGAAAAGSTAPAPKAESASTPQGGK
ncbi:MAG: LSU ribosomal protein L22p (L17e) [Candidatus Ozemobacter sibiricus]|jgi:large subunit ribosomal protein L22|uniref:Large ribosomal subunit protein uL22 n=1 Tax=Candidatus Ozemobacter sibiricus TaxID=2268124 RepID=A0A367ZK25_9BACT|nr:MAG: LSU ribosomal protein L22p (L17e) [Candidatus Ozemobacter sibiricus]